MGSEIQRKAAGIFTVEKEEGKDYFIIKALKVRDGSPLDVPQIIITWDKNLKFHVYGGEKDQIRPKEGKNKS